MKKIYLLCAAAMLAVSLPVLAQEQQSKPTDIFVKTVPILMVYTHQLGYKVVFVNSKQEAGSFYLPITWFGKAGGKGTIVLENADVAPYFSIFWADGKFDHIVLHVSGDTRAAMWGVLETNEDLKSAFAIEEPTLSF